MARLICAIIFGCFWQTDNLNDYPSDKRARISGLLVTSDLGNGVDFMFNFESRIDKICTKARQNVAPILRSFKSRNK